MTDLVGYNVLLRPVVYTDLDRLLLWRNTPAILQSMLTPAATSKAQIKAWFRKISRDQSQQHWVIEFKGQPIGCANIKAVYYGQTIETATCVEPGLYIADARYRDNILAFAPTLLINDYCFSLPVIKQLRALVLNSNQPAINYNLQLGYKIQKNAQILELTLTKVDYYRASQILKQMLSRENCCQHNTVTSKESM